MRDYCTRAGRRGHGLRTLSHMIQSMTGYAAVSADSARGRISLELRSVNARFLDLQFRIVEELRMLEPTLREMIVARASRGKVDCRLFLNQNPSSSVPQQLNAEAIARLRALADDAKRSFPEAGGLRIADVLRWPGVVAEPAADENQLRRLAEQLCRQGLEDLVGARAREGAKLAASILERVASMRKRVEDVAPLVPQALGAYRAKLAERLREAIGSADDERLRAEMVLFATRIDVDEELTRLKAHLGEVERTVQKGGAVGKRLDFLAQELNREANTLASKAGNQQIAECALELKLLIEQVREQVQNIE
jgi:uncharacterized protein (TIGR00255 family)